MIHHNKILIDRFRLLRKNSSILQLRAQDSNNLERIEITSNTIRLTRQHNLLTDLSGYNYDLIFLRNEFFTEDSFIHSAIYRENT